MALQQTIVIAQKNGPVAHVVHTTQRKFLVRHILIDPLEEVVEVVGAPHLPGRPQWGNGWHAWSVCSLDQGRGGEEGRGGSLGP